MSKKKTKFNINLGKTLGDIKSNMDRDVSKKILPSSELVQNLSKDFAFVPVDTAMILLISFEGWL